MDTDIFRLGLSQEALTLFLLLTYLGGRGSGVTRGAVEASWKGSPAEFQNGFEELRRVGALEERQEYLVLAPLQSWTVNGGIC